MKKTNIIAQDTITIINRTILHNSDRKLLTILYQPIIGGMAINLYLTLWALLDIKEISSNLIDFKKVMNQTGYTINEVMEAKKNLEAIGLIKTYMRSIEKQNDYLIAIYSPLDAGRFFSNPLFCNLLLTSVGKVEFESIRNLFRVPNVDIKDFEEVSARFDEVFTTSADLIMQSDMIQKRRRSEERRVGKEC